MQIQQVTFPQVNWILIGIYVLLCLAQIIFSNWETMDAAGRGMAQGFLMIYCAYVVLMACLNLINVKWVSVIVLVLCILPPLNVLRHLIRAVFQ